MPSTTRPHLQTVAEYEAYLPNEHRRLVNSPIISEAYSVDLSSVLYFTGNVEEKKTASLWFVKTCCLFPYLRLWQDSNLQPSDSKSDALSDCATQLLPSNLARRQSVLSKTSLQIYKKIRKCCRGRKIRTLTNGFGDRYATVTPYPYMPISSPRSQPWSWTIRKTASSSDIQNLLTGPNPWQGRKPG